ncbi:toll-like receptor 13 [Liolophura sinensis]|uniref:toll-like receptor 13 n=1 Tax=Liolophura sinensis TaxID=3198878 RepID=UPI003158882F
MIAQLITVTVIFVHTNAEGRHVDLHNHRLRKVPTNIPSTTESLDLSDNLLKTIPNDSFIKLNALTSLDLSGNRLERLEPSAFRGLSRLSTLRLSENNLLLTYEAYPVGVFRPLQKLEALALEKNLRNPYSELGEYPEQIFSGLSSLKELRIDGLRNVSFGSGFLHLSSLKSLYVIDDNKQVTLNAHTFAVFANMSIETLRIVCLGMKPGTLKHFPFLTTLNMRTDGLGRALSALVDLRWRNLTSLSIVRANENRGGRLNPENLILTTNMTAHLATMCVKHLDLSGNKIILVNGDVLLDFHYPDSYNYHNYQWACIVLRNVLENENNYTLCLHDRDFPVGVSIQQNIVDAVNNSRKVILVISKAFLTSDWCEFEIQMAGMRMVRDGRENAIIVIMMEEIPVAEMPRSLLNLWKHITFLLWDNEQADEPEFWDRLLEVMARP